MLTSQQHAIREIGDDMAQEWKVLNDWSVEIWFLIEKDDEGYPQSKKWEKLFAWPVLERDDYFSIESIPFFVKGISRGDIVRAVVSINSEVQEGKFFQFESVVNRGGHNTYRLLLCDKQPHDPEFTENELIQKGLAVEVEDDDFFAIDVPPSVDQKEIDAYLISQSESGRWGLQDGYLFSETK
jgi:hypothetical protein